MPSSEDDRAPRRTLAAVVAYLDLLVRGWEALSQEERKKGVQLALEAARRKVPPPT